MNKTETFNQLGKQPTGQCMLDIARLTAEMRHNDHETIHRLADVLNPLAKSMADLCAQASKGIFDISSKRSEMATEIDRLKEQLMSVKLNAVKLDELVTLQISAAVRQAVQGIKEVEGFKIATRIPKMFELILVTTTTALLAMFFYMRFLN